MKTPQYSFSSIFPLLTCRWLEVKFSGRRESSFQLFKPYGSSEIILVSLKILLSKDLITPANVNQLMITRSGNQEVFAFCRKKNRTKTGEKAREYT